jgi:hypothetical protein
MCEKTLANQRQDFFVTVRRQLITNCYDDADDYSE